MSFLNPEFFWLILPILSLFGFKAKASDSKQPKSITLYGHIAVLILITTSLSRPVLDNGIKENRIESKNIIIALDVSYSMRASDIEPSRYDFAKETIEAFLNNNPKSNITLLAFTQNTLLLSPPTTDHQLIMVALKTLNPNYILTKGTSLKNLFHKVGQLKAKDKNLLLISDGGEEENIEELREILDKKRINLSILAVGTTRGATIRTNTGLLKDKEGNLVVSAINPLLQELTSNYTETKSTPASTAKELKNILNIEKKEQIKKLQHSYREFYQIPLLVALILFFTLHTKFIRYILLILTLFGVSAEASLLDDYHLTQAYKAYQEKAYKVSQNEIKKIKKPSLESVTIYAHNLYRLKAYKKAITAYKSIKSTSVSTKQHLYYNIANAYTQLKRYDEAKKYYIYALQLGEDSDSKYNLKKIIFKENQKNTKLGIANPKSQSSESTKSESQEPLEDEKENKPSSASGSSSSGVESHKKAKKEQKKKQLLLDPNSKKEVHPISSKVYELINKGYIYETKPW